MAKKKIIVINQEELASTTLATKVDSKKSSIIGIIWLFLIFTIFIGGVLYLPDLAAYVSSYLNPEVTGNNSNNNSNSQNKNDNENNETILEKKYEITDDLKIEDEQKTISNIKITGNKITFEIENKTDEILDLSSEKYFLHLYDEKDTLLQRIILNDGIVEKNSKILLSYDLTNSNIKTISLLKISTSEYPAYNVVANEAGSYLLNCTKENEIITYYFNGNKVYAIDDTFEVPESNLDYNTLYTTYSTLAATYNNIGGVTSNIGVVDNVLTFKTVISLSLFKEGTIDNKIIYALDTDAKIIKFELEASGYTCK